MTSLLSAAPSPTPSAGGVIGVDWWAVVLDGLLGAAVGGLFSLAVALYLTRRTATDQRQLAREQAALAAAEDLTGAIIRCQKIFGEQIGFYNERAFYARMAAFSGCGGGRRTQEPGAQEPW